jgi:hypothetical protein
MRFDRYLAVLLVLLLAPGCVRSLHPIYSDDTLTYDPAFLGAWVSANGETRLEIAASSTNDEPDAVKSYSVTHTDKDGQAGHFVGHLAKVGNLLVADLTVGEEQKLPDSDFYKAHLAPLHTFWVVRLDGADAMTVRAIEHDWMNQFLDANPTAVAHYKSRDDILLIAPTAELQKFLRAHANDKGMLSDVETFRRMKPPASAPAPAPASGPTTAAPAAPRGF